MDLKENKKVKNKTLSYYNVMIKNLNTKAQAQSVPAEVSSEIYQELETLKKRIEWNRKVYL